MKSTDALPGGRAVETLGALKNRPSPWYHFHSSPAYLWVPGGDLTEYIKEHHSADRLGRVVGVSCSILDDAFTLS